MNKFDDHKTPLKTLSPALMAAYLKGELSPELQHAVEKYLLDHPFEAEAMEGYAENLEAFDDLSLLDKRLADRLNEEGKKTIFPFWRRYLPFAASFIILLVATITAVYFYGKVGTEDEISLEDADIIPLDSFNRKIPALPYIDTTTIAKIESPTVKGSKVNDKVRKVETDKETQIKPDEVAGQNDITIAEVRSNEENTEKPEASSQPMAIATLEDSLEEDLLKEEDGVAVKRESLAKKVAERSPSSPKLDNDILEQKGKKESVASNAIMIKGEVSDAETGEVLPGVNIILKNSNTGVNTDLDGHFSIEAGIGDILIVNFIGMESKEVEITSNSFQEISLSTDVRQLSEVVVTGYSSSSDNTPTPYQPATPEVGMKAYKAYLKKNLSYPQAAIKEAIEGKVRLKITITANGQTDAIEVIKSLSEECDAEAIRLIKEGPSWNAAEKDGNQVESTVRLKVVFELPE